jgi:hypothetical protein
VFIRYKFNEEFVEVNVKKHGQLPQHNPLDKNYSGLLLVNAEKLKDLRGLLSYIPAVNHSF